MMIKLLTGSLKVAGGIAIFVGVCELVAYSIERAFRRG